MAYTDIDKPSDYFSTKLYTGNGSTNAITGVGFQPDWVWCKARSYNDDHFTFDAVRGVTKHIRTNSDSAEVTNTNSLTAFGSDGFTLGSDGGANSNTDTYASWNWLAGNGTASNSNGSITSTVSANTTSGFSIVSYTGTGSNATVGHGLGVAPAMIIIKCRSRAEEWVVYNQGLGNAYAIPLHLTEAKSTSATFWQNTNPSSSVFYIGANNKHNQSGQTFIAYCFSEKKGFSKFNSYTGNGNNDGTFIYTGFKPAWVLIKRTDTTSNWLLFDNKRAYSYNLISATLKPNTNGAEDTNGAYNNVDFISNGIKLRQSNGDLNASGGSYIYHAFAENPFVTSTGIPTTAR